MAKSRHHSLFFKVFLLQYLVCCISGIEIDVTRQQKGDFFTNPYALSCQDNHVDGSFCRIADSSCYSDRPHVGDKCCLCRCDTLESTFDLRNLQCALNKDIRKGCTLLVNRKNNDEVLIEIDLHVDGFEIIKVPHLSKDSNLHGCADTKVEEMTRDGYKGVHRFFWIDTNSKTFSIKWSGSPNENQVHGKVYRINIRCQIKKKRGSNKWSDVHGCLMIKSNGTLKIDHPGLPSASISSSPLTSSLQTSSLSATSSTAAVASSSPHLIQPTSTVPALHQPLSSTSELPQSSYSSSFANSEPTLRLTSEYNMLTSKRTLYSTTTGRLSFSTNIEQECTTQKTSTATVMEKSVKSNPDESGQTVTSTVVNQEQTKASGSKKRSSGKNKRIVVYLTVTVAILVVIILVAVVVWYVVFLKTRAKEKPGRSSRAVNPGSTKNEHINGEDFALRSMKNDENIYEGIYELTSDEPHIKRTVSGGIENARFVDISKNNVALYTALDECRDKASNYQALIFPIGANRTTSPNVCKLSVPTCDEQQEITSEPVYQSLEEPLTYVDISSDEQTSNQDNQVYSTLEEYQEPEMNKACDPPVYADLTQQREENEYQGLVTRKM